MPAPPLLPARSGTAQYIETLIDATHAQTRGDLAPRRARKGLSTMWGVSLPCLQNILGVILFIRLPWIAAQAGTLQSTIIVLGCAAVSFLTALSLSAIATNGALRPQPPSGHASHSAGRPQVASPPGGLILSSPATWAKVRRVPCPVRFTPPLTPAAEVGAAVGVLFYTGTTVASTMYVLGAVEAFQKAFGFENRFTFDMQVEGLAVMLTLAIVVTVGALATRWCVPWPWQRALTLSPTPQGSATSAWLQACSWPPSSSASWPTWWA